MRGKGQKKDIRILVVDDEPVIQELLKDILCEEGYEITLASNGAEALEKVKEDRFHIIFSDVHMPVMNGIEFVKCLRKIDGESVIIMMDSYPNQLVEIAKKEGALTCLHKPFNIWEIKEIVEKIHAIGIH
jgi:CheY-like chemotaxis protein